MDFKGANGIHPSHLENRIEYKLHSILFKKETATFDTMLDWIIDNGYKIKRADDAGDYIRFIQSNPPNVFNS